ncbi:MAG TPA: MFS transporter [Xanthobacteraceae bacterium]|nr:MFS transporter [Xanthobacteraceae bacterium]
MVPALGIVQILMWGSTFYLLAVLAPAIVAETGWPFPWVIAGVTIALMVAGLISPLVGRIIDRRGGRPVLAFSSLATAASFAAMGAATTLPAYFAAWVLTGVGMGTGLYDAVFAALGRLYGKEARSAITNLTLFGGFGSTVCWPLSAYFVAEWDWRVACFAYAALHLLVALPIQVAAFPTEPARGPSEREGPSGDAAVLSRRDTVAFWLLAGVQTLAQAIGSIIIVHLLVFLQARGLTLAAAVALGTLFGPAQVAARVIERLFGHRYHPIWTMILAAALMALGLAMLLIDLPILAAAVMIYGAGYGVTWIARGTLPLALFGPERYAVLIGRLALPSLLAQALSPFVGALLIERLGAEGTLGVLLALALANAGLVSALWVFARAAAPSDQ